MVIRNVLSLNKVGCGCTELHLDCGHVQRRRLGLCPPSRVDCAECRRGAPAGAEPRLAPRPQETSNVP